MRTVDRKDLTSRIMAMMVLRVVLAIAFLGITTWFQLRTSAETGAGYYPLYGIVVAVGLLTILYAVSLQRIRNQRLFIYVQVSIDILLVTAIVYVTGGTESYLPTLYLLAIIGSTMMLSRRGGLYTASFSSIAYGVLIDMDFYGMLPASYKVFTSGQSPEWAEVFTTVATNILAFYVVAYLTGYLAERAAKVERRLEEKEIDFERLEVLNRQIVENITSGIMTLDANLRVTSFNSAAEQVTGFTLREVYYRSVHAVFPGMVDPEQVTTPVGMRGEGSFKKKDGEDAYLGYTISQAREEGDATYIVIFQDLTRLKVMEEQIRRDDKLRALGELSVGIAHEIRNPLASISGSIQLLNEQLRSDNEENRLMAIILRETTRLNELITDFLLFAKPAHEKRANVDLAVIISETLEMFRNSPESEGIEIETDLPGAIFVEANARQIGQVFWNLYLNAAHAMGSSGRLRVTSTIVDDLLPAEPPGKESEEAASIPAFERAEQEHEVRLTPVAWAGNHATHVIIKVVDNGPGIDETDINRIFDPFFSTKESGSGLGLSIVHRIVESHGGTIDVTSNKSEGTVFRVRLPLASAAHGMHAV